MMGEASWDDAPTATPIENILRVRREAQAYRQVIMVFADGGVMGANPSELGGTWAWCHVDGLNKMICHGAGVWLPTRQWPRITNNMTEFIAVVRALEPLPDGWSGSVCTDSQVTLRRFELLMRAPVLIDGLPDSLTWRAHEQITRLHRIRFTLLQGHPTQADLRKGVGSKGLPVSRHNVFCDERCGVAGRWWASQLAAGATVEAQEPRSATTLYTP